MFSVVKRRLTVPYQRFEYEILSSLLVKFSLDLSYGFRRSVKVVCCQEHNSGYIHHALRAYGCASAGSELPAMTQTRSAHYDGHEIDATFHQTFEYDSDLKQWCGLGDATLAFVEIMGRVVDPAELPKNVLEALLDESDQLEWSPL